MGQRARVVAAIVLSVAVLASLGLSGCTREKPAPTDPAWVPPGSTAAAVGTPRPLTGGQESSSGGVTDATPDPSEAEGPEAGAESPDVVVPTPGPSTPVAQPGSFTYVVDPGDTLFSIANRYGTSVDVLVRLNRLSSGDQISVGQSLQVPTSGGDTGGGGAAPAQPSESGMHTVQAGETLFSIAQRYGLTTRDLMAANGITDPDHIIVGQNLSIPGGGSGGGAPSSGTEYHVVQRGETMLTIAVSYGISVQDLASANGISDPDLISVGQSLIIP
jgi:LysM repeat protein